MAIKGNINFKGLLLEAYVKITIGSVSEVIDSETKEKTFVLNYNSEFRVTKESDSFHSWSDKCNYDLASNPYSIAYADLSEKLKIELKEI